MKKLLLASALVICFLAFGPSLSTALLLGAGVGGGYVKGRLDAGKDRRRIGR